MITNASGDTSVALFGMTLSRNRTRAAQEELNCSLGKCSLGIILVASSEKGITAILIGDDPEALKRDLHDRFPRARLVNGDATHDRVLARVVSFVEAPQLDLDFPLDVRGTKFQQKVWRALRDIPAGRTTTYTDIAVRLGAPSSARAVAGACAANVLAVAIPCHRVVRNDGILSGYRWGVERKRELLAREAQI